MQHLKREYTVALRAPPVSLDGTHMHRMLNTFMLRRTTVTIAIAIGVFSLGAGLLTYYRFHLSWVYTSAMLDGDVQSVPVRALPIAPFPEDWPMVHVRGVSFHLPPGLPETEEKVGNAVVFKQNGRSIGVIGPEDNSDLSGMLSAASKACPVPQEFTLPKLMAAWHQADSRNFRWTMTPQEARWHVFCASLGSAFQSRSVCWVETLYRDDVDGIILYYEGDNNAAFVWQARNPKGNRLLGGQIDFAQRGILDREFVRFVCESLRVSSCP